MKYRKKPVVIEARKLTIASLNEICKWANASEGRNGCAIPTLEGCMTARIGDYIIRGVQGEFYPCKPDIFEATYERVEQ
jgi:hypothetical protein